MGRNLALNIESRGVPVAVWNLESEWVDDFLRDHQGHAFAGTKTFEELAASLERPRRILMMIPAGKPVDQTIEKIQPVLEAGDVLIDGGNSWFEDTRRREAALRPAGIHYVGCGVSGGEEGARYGPSIMPGGSAEAWERDQGRARGDRGADRGGPCVTHVGTDGAGHFVKMVHNGIEYGDMQLIAEAWDVLRRGLGLSAPETADVFDEWNRGRLESFLVELTATGLSRDGSGNQAAARRRRARQGRPEGNGTLDDAGRAGPWRRGPDDCRRARRAWPVEPEGRTGRGVTVHRRP